MPNGILRDATERGKANGTDRVEVEFDLEEQIKVRRWKW